MARNNTGSTHLNEALAERERTRREIAQDRALIDKSRVSVVDAKRHVADSVDRLAESQKQISR